MSGYRFVPVSGEGPRNPYDIPQVSVSWWTRNRPWIMGRIVCPIVVVIAMAFILCGGFVFLLPLALVRKNRQNRRVRTAVTTQTRTVDPAAPYSNL